MPDGSWCRCPDHPDLGERTLSRSAGSPSARASVRSKGRKHTCTDWTAGLHGQALSLASCYLICCRSRDAAEAAIGRHLHQGTVPHHADSSCHRGGRRGARVAASRDPRARVPSRARVRATQACPSPAGPDQMVVVHAATPYYSWKRCAYCALPPAQAPRPRAGPRWCCHARCCWLDPCLAREARHVLLRVLCAGGRRCPRNPLHCLAVLNKPGRLCHGPRASGPRRCLNK